MINKVAYDFEGATPGADGGKQVFSVTKTQSMKQTIVKAIEIVRQAMAAAGQSFNKANDDYQALLGDYIDACGSVGVPWEA